MCNLIELFFGRMRHSSDRREGLRFCRVHAIVSQGGDVEAIAVTISVAVRFSVSRMTAQGGLRGGGAQIHCVHNLCLYRPRFTVNDERVF